MTPDVQLLIWALFGCFNGLAYWKFIKISGELTVGDLFFGLCLALTGPLATAAGFISLLVLGFVHLMDVRIK